MARILDHRVKELFPDGAVVRAELLRDCDAPGRLTVRVVVAAAEDLAAWAATHQGRMEELRRELSLSINPVTGTNWQGTGVIPDTTAPADQAYRVAYAKALRHVAELRDVPPPIADEARDALATLTDEAAGPEIRRDQ